MSRFRSQNALFGPSRGRVEVEVVTPKQVNRVHSPASATLASPTERTGLAVVTEADDGEVSNEPFTMFSYPLDNYVLTPTDTAPAAASSHHHHHHHRDAAVRGKAPPMTAVPASSALSPSTVAVTQG